MRRTGRERLHLLVLDQVGEDGGQTLGLALIVRGVHREQVVSVLVLRQVQQEVDHVAVLFDVDDVGRLELRVAVVRERCLARAGRVRSDAGALVAQAVLEIEREVDRLAHLELKIQLGRGVVYAYDRLGGVVQRCHAQCVQQLGVGSDEDVLIRRAARSVRGHARHW